MNRSPFSARADLGFAWSVKDTFLQYIRGMPDGDITWSNGAAVTDAGQFYFPLASSTHNSGVTTLCFGGQVRFTAHRGLLSVFISEPIVRVRSDAAQLSVRLGSKEQHIADIDLSPRIIDHDVAMWLDAKAHLAGDGAEMFGGTYSLGEPLAPLTIRVPVAAAPTE
jgi:hypothetical protein